MNNYFSSLTKEMKTDFIVNPGLLLQVKQVLALDAISCCCILEQHANQLFFPPVDGVYLKNSNLPLFTAHEELFTHDDAYEFFPEISSSIFDTNLVRIKAQLPTVGKKINWRQAVEQKINVYNKNGRLLLRSNQNRDDLIFNPNSTIHCFKFVKDIINYSMLQATAWGDESTVLQDIDIYKEEDVDIDKLLELGINICFDLVKQVRSFVASDPWLIYSLNNLATNIFVQSSCDYRHYKANEVLWNQNNKKDDDDDLLSTYQAPINSNQTVNADDVEEFFEFLQIKGFPAISNIKELFNLIEQYKNDPKATDYFVKTFKEFIAMKKNNGKTVSIIKQLLRT